MDLSFKSLKAKQSELRSDFSEPLSRRVHRAWSWLNRAEQAGGNDDAGFINGVNRDQARNGRRILASLAPLFVDIMMDKPDVDWGAPYYPVID